MTTIVLCERCCTPCSVSPERNEQARLLRHADTGVCVNCAVTAFLRTMEPLASVLAAKGPEVLLNEAAQAQFAAVLAAGFADARADEIDWRVVVAQWDLSDLSTPDGDS